MASVTCLLFTGCDVLPYQGFVLGQRHWLGVGTQRVFPLTDDACTGRGGGREGVFVTTKPAAVFERDEDRRLGPSTQSSSSAGLVR